MKMVNTVLLKEWLAHNGRRAHAKLSIEADVSTYLIARILCGQAPKKISTRARLSQATGIPEEELFPEVQEEIVTPTRRTAAR